MSVETLPDAAGARVRWADRAWHVVLHARAADGWRGVDVDGLRRQRLLLDDGQCVHLARDAAVHVFAEPSPFPQPDASAACRASRAPVAGVVAQVGVAVGQRVAAGRAAGVRRGDENGDVAQRGRRRRRQRGKVHVAPRDTVASGAVLVELDLDGPEESKGTT